MLVLLLCLMSASLLTISSTTSIPHDLETDLLFFTPHVKKQLYFFLAGWLAFFTCSAIDYNRLREWTWILYALVIFLLIGLFFTPSIQNVHRWYKVAGLTFQPSEFAKLSVVLALSWFLDYKTVKIKTLTTAFQAFLIILFPFFLILKQPDLGTALVLFPVTLMMFYFGHIHKSITIALSSLAAIGFVLIGLIFSGALDHEQMRPFFTKFLHDYQYERLSPNTYHQQAAQTAIALGKYTGSGWHKSEFTKGQWLPAAHTDSVFAAIAEEFGLLGVIFLLGLFFGLIYVSFEVTAVAKDRFGQLLSSGIAIYLAVHIVVNLGMMCGFLPITGVPLVLISYGGSSIVATMSALGILQSIYSRRFTF